MTIGIYQIVNLINGKLYIGSAINIEFRFNVHKHQLRYNKHKNKHLQHAWNKYGEDAFEFKILEQCNKNDLLKYEQFWLDWTKCYERKIGYNLHPKARSPFGYKHTKETKLKMAFSNKLNKPNRNLNKWPHFDAARCKCRECRDKRNLLLKAHRDKHKHMYVLSGVQIHI